MAKLWRRMIELYGHRWTTVHGEAVDSEGSSAGTWAKGLAGLTGQQLGAGLEACIARADEWPPNLPSFRALCLGIPKLSTVRRELTTYCGQRSGFTVLVWAHLDTYAYRRAEGRAAERMLQEAYDEAREAVMRGLPIPPQAPAIAPPETPAPKPADPEVVQRSLDEARAFLGITPPVDPCAEEDSHA